MNIKTKWIQALKIWTVIYPSITLFQSVFGEYLAQFPLYIKTLILTMVLVPWMVFIGLPLLNKLVEMVVNNEKS